MSKSAYLHYLYLISRRLIFFEDSKHAPLASCRSILPKLTAGEEEAAHRCRLRDDLLREEAEKVSAYQAEKKKAAEAAAAAAQQQLHQHPALAPNPNFPQQLYSGTTHYGGQQVFNPPVTAPPQVPPSSAFQAVSSVPMTVPNPTVVASTVGQPPAQSQPPPPPPPPAFEPEVCFQASPHLGLNLTISNQPFPSYSPWNRQ